MITFDPSPIYTANSERYQTMTYRQCGRSGLRLPKLALGLWQNFGGVDSQQNARLLLQHAFDAGITHFDLANNYGPPYGSAEANFGAIFRRDFLPYRDELIISSKAGYDMWPGPYGMGGSRKYLVSSCDQSLKRTGLAYFDIFYHHCLDPNTPLEETMQALDFIVRSGRALYVGISNYSAEKTLEAHSMLQSLGTPLLIHQPRYNILDRWIEAELTQVLLDKGIGAIAFSPLAQGVLTNKYLSGIPSDSRAARKEAIYLHDTDITPEKLKIVTELNYIAKNRGQRLAQMAISWALNNPAITTCLIGASKVEQLQDSIAALNNTQFKEDELMAINKISGQ